jgi:hypothetical protein
MWQAKGNFCRDEILIVEAIVQEISRRAQQMVQKWGQENMPPPADVYSLANTHGGNLHVIQKTFQGDFEVPPPDI